jgi:hypothetical protein
MAKAKSTTSVRTFIRKSKKKRRGVHAKTKTSTAKGSKNYKKRYNSQGK